MGSNDASSITKRNRKKAPVGGPMNLEEQRMNKEILKEISNMKKVKSTRAEEFGIQDNNW